MPADECTTDLKCIGRVTNPGAYIDLKEKWLVSLQVVGYRAANLGIIEAKQPEFLCCTTPERLFTMRATRRCITNPAANEGEVDDRVRIKK